MMSTNSGTWYINRPETPKHVCSFPKVSYVSWSRSLGLRFQNRVSSSEPWDLRSECSFGKLLEFLAALNGEGMLLTSCMNDGSLRLACHFGRPNSLKFKKASKDRDSLDTCRATHALNLGAESRKICVMSLLLSKTLDAPPGASKQKERLDASSEQKLPLPLLQGCQNKAGSCK